MLSNFIVSLIFKHIILESNYKIIKTVPQNHKSYEQLCANTFENLNEIGGFLYKLNLLKLTPEEKEKQNRPVTIKKQNQWLYKCPHIRKYKYLTRMIYKNRKKKRR